jgi:hypothetical protein
LNDEANRRFQTDLARIQVNAGVQTSVGVGFLTASIAVLVTTISIGRIDSYDEALQYSTHAIVTLILLTAGIFSLWRAKKIMDGRFKELISIGSLQNRKPHPKGKNLPRTSRAHESILSWARRFWVCKGNIRSDESMSMVA